MEDKHARLLAVQNSAAVCLFVFFFFFLIFISNWPQGEGGIEI
jgi:hypothetical protein